MQRHLGCIYDVKNAVGAVAADDGLVGIVAQNNDGLDDVEIAIGCGVVLARAGQPELAVHIKGDDAGLRGAVVGGNHCLAQRAIAVASAVVGVRCLGHAEGPALVVRQRLETQRSIERILGEAMPQIVVGLFRVRHLKIGEHIGPRCA